MRKLNNRLSKRIIFSICLIRSTYSTVEIVPNQNFYKEITCPKAFCSYKDFWEDILGSVLIHFEQNTILLSNTNLRYALNYILKCRAHSEIAKDLELSLSESITENYIKSRLIYRSIKNMEYKFYELLDEVLKENFDIISKSFTSGFHFGDEYIHNLFSNYFSTFSMEYAEFRVMIYIHVFFYKPIFGNIDGLIYTKNPITVTNIYTFIKKHRNLYYILICVSHIECVMHERVLPTHKCMQNANFIKPYYMNRVYTFQHLNSVNLMEPYGTMLVDLEQMMVCRNTCNSEFKSIIKNLLLFAGTNDSVQRNNIYACLVHLLYSTFAGVGYNLQKQINTHTTIDEDYRYFVERINTYVGWEIDEDLGLPDEYRGIAKYMNIFCSNKDKIKISISLHTSFLEFNEYITKHLKLNLGGNVKSINELDLFTYDKYILYQRKSAYTKLKETKLGSGLRSRLRYSNCDYVSLPITTSNWNINSDELLSIVFYIIYICNAWKHNECMHYIIMNKNNYLNNKKIINIILPALEQEYQILKLVNFAKKQADGNIISSINKLKKLRKLSTKSGKDAEMYDYTNNKI